MVLPHLDIEDTVDTKNLQPQAKYHILQEIITKIAENIDITVIIDDFQWVDDISQNIILSMMKTAKRVMEPFLIFLI